MSEVTSEPRCFIRHIRAARLCSGGTRQWWSAHNLDWNDFLANGIDGGALLNTGDPLAMRVVEAARAEQNGQ